jgi:dipeptidyl-peptidase 4
MLRTARLVVWLSVIPAAVAQHSQPDLRTVAEKSEYRATARYAEVVELLDRLAAVSPLAVRGELGRSGEGRAIPLLVIADPPVRTPEDARKQVADGKLLVLAIGNIHAGEVDGKEALPMVARELLTTPSHPLLKDLIVAIAPIYNTDGNEQVSKDNRPGQLGPDDGMGRRENAAGLDLNRDYLKLEASETRGLVEFFNRWDPAIFIDTHTTNGSYHRYVITWEGPKAPAGDAAIVEFARERMLPAIARQAEEEYGVPSFVYGDFDATHEKWETYPAHARYGTTYFGLRNRLSVLSEGYSYAPYKTRVLATRDYVKAILEFAAREKTAIRDLLEQADQRTRAGVGRPLALRSVAGPAPEKILARGYEVAQPGRDKTPPGEPRDFSVQLWTHFNAARSVARPWAYVVPADRSTVLDTLRLHGIVGTPLAEAIDVDAQVSCIDKVEFAERPFQGHRLATVSATVRTERRRLAAGSVIVRTDVPLGLLAAYLLEPECEDGLTTWNFFDADLVVGRDFPVLRVMQPIAGRE